MRLSNCNILVTGANGFIGKNLVVRLSELQGVKVINFIRGDEVSSLPMLVSQADAVVHLAGENRPEDPSSFIKVNKELTVSLCDAIEKKILNTGNVTPLLFVSSIHAESDTLYGRSKLAAEKAVEELARNKGNPCVVFRLPGVFGKWCKPNYNSVVSTFCFNIARNLSIQVSDPLKSLRLVYIDDVVTTLLDVLSSTKVGFSRIQVKPEYMITLGELESQIRGFANSRITLEMQRVGTAFTRALYSTYVSYLPIESFLYKLPDYSDARGRFVEMVKTTDSGQLSYFTANPGVTRGGHYHHTKTEKFLVVKGEALFRFRDLLTNSYHEIQTSSNIPQIVESIPGWVHDITNVGRDEMIVMLWANEKFDPKKPDTVTHKI